MQRRTILLSSVLGLAFLSTTSLAATRGSGRRRPPAGSATEKRTPRRGTERAVPARGTAGRSGARHLGGKILRPRLYARRQVDPKRYRDIVLPNRPDGASYRLLRPRSGRGNILIERARDTSAGVVREFSILGLATRHYQRRIHCSNDCGPDQIDPGAYREVSLGEVGLDRYLLLVPRSDDDPVLIERVVGATNFSDVSTLNL